MTTTELRAAACDGKLRYPSYFAAASVRKGRRRRHTAEPYRCQWCKCWHVGNPMMRRRAV